MSLDLKILAYEPGMEKPAPGSRGSLDCMADPFPAPTAFPTDRYLLTKVLLL